ncbi:uncharacterized protein LOC131973810 [Centropristis striata]|uniref:uncharacterized protein LOC131973810 n=1 Tax=Centropristis striata TaxID=184440 RepID=UPI0027E17F2A|nr:uncharacterized protein LOC131973810 [Centropristis striata]
MIDTDVALEALNVLCSAGVTAAHRQGSGSGSGSAAADISGGAAQLQQGMRELSIRHLIPLVLFGDHSSIQGYTGPDHFRPVLRVDLPKDLSKDKKTGEIEISPNAQWSKKHLDPGFDYDFTNLKDSGKYYRGGEQYERPCGWKRFALKVLDEYEDNTWLGNNYRSTESVPGEWPVSYHGTAEKCVKPIIEENYKAGGGQVYGRGIYCTPKVAVAEEEYSVEFKSEKTSGKFKAVLQNRINPKYRKICKRKDYWLVEFPKNATPEEEHEIVKKAIRPYGLLLKEI